MRLHFHDRKLPATLGHGVEHNAADEARADQHDLGRSLRLRHDLACVVQRPAVYDPIQVYTGNWWAGGMRSCCHQQLVKENGVPIAHFLRAERSGLTVSPDSRAGMQRGLVTVQSALATLLLVSATLLVATVGNLRDVPLGFDPEGIVTVELSPPADRVETVPAAREHLQRRRLLVPAV